ncbi:MAG: hypothetical protein JXA22_08605 [Candidatus Thermoplasmatota archaeon]|nr:hypothetical protein [Candidatus Thermoplasmatota archaeon]
MYKDIIKTVRRLSPFLLSHHPDCSFFDQDIYRVFGKKICLGCSIAYPTAFLVIISSLLTGWYRSFPELIIHEDMLIIASMMMGSLQFIKYVGLRSSRPLNIFIKISLGLSLGGITVWIFTIPIHLIFRILLFIIFFIFVQFLGSLRFRSVRNICADCIYHGDWDICPGFRNINRYHDFSHIVDRRGLERLIFDRKRKQRPSYGSRMRRTRKPPIDLVDGSKRWTYHDIIYEVPWLPGPRFGVSRYEDIPHGKREAYRSVTLHR